MLAPRPRRGRSPLHDRLGGRRHARGGHASSAGRRSRSIDAPPSGGRARRAKPATCAPRRCARSRCRPTTCSRTRNTRRRRAIQGVGPYLRAVSAPAADSRRPIDERERLAGAMIGAAACRSAAGRAAARASLAALRSPRCRRVAGARPRMPAHWLARAAQRRAARSTMSARSSTSTAAASRRRGSRTSTTTARSTRSSSTSTGPAREVIRSQGEVRCYYPDAKLVRIEPRTFRNVFPSLSPQQQQVARRVSTISARREPRASRGLDAQAWRVRAEGRPALRPQVLGRTRRPGCCSRRACWTSSGEVVEQFAFTDLTIGATIDRDRWSSRRGRDAARLAGARRSVRRGRAAGHRLDRRRACRRASRRSWKAFASCAAGATPVAHLVFSDGLVAVSVFVEPFTRRRAPDRAHRSRAGSTSTCRQLDDNLVTVLGEAPGATVRQIAHSVARR